MGPLRPEVPRSPRALHPPHSDEITVVFHSQMLWELFLALSPKLGSPVCVWVISFLKGNLCSQDIPPDFYFPHMGVGPACSCLCPSILSVASSLYPQWQDFCSARFQVVPNNVCSVGQLWQDSSTTFTYAVILTRILFMSFLMSMQSILLIFKPHSG